MQVRFLVNLGSIHAAECNKATGASLSPKECKAGEVVEISEDTAKWFSKSRDFAGLFEEIKEESKEPKLKAIAKEPAISGVKEKDVK